MPIMETSERSSRRTAVRRLGTGGLAAILAAGGLGRASERVRAEPLPRFVLDWFGAWSSDDPVRNLAALYGPDGSYEDVPSGASVLAPEIAAYLPTAAVRPATVNRYLRGSFAVDGLAVVEQLFYATAEPFSPGLPPGAPFEVFAATIFEYDDKALHRTVDYYDFASILRQVGSSSAIPPSGDTNLLWA
jgi:hypothetical protein